MNIGLTIVKWEKEPNIQRESHTLHRNNDLKTNKPLPQPKKMEQKAANHMIGESAPCHCPTKSDQVL